MLIFPYLYKFSEWTVVWQLKNINNSLFTFILYLIMESHIGIYVHMCIVYSINTHTYVTIIEHYGFDAQVVPSLATEAIHISSGIHFNQWGFDKLICFFSKLMVPFIHFPSGPGISNFFKNPDLFWGEILCKYYNLKGYMF